MKVKAIIIAVIVLILIIAILTKPDDKTIIIKSVKAVWGSVTPDESVPQYYEQFMDLNSKSVHIDNWIVLKRIQYTFGNNTRTIGFAAFGKVILRK